MNRILKRCLQKLNLKEEAIPSEVNKWKELLDFVSQCFNEAEQEQLMMERSLEICSEEMTELYREQIKKSESIVAQERDKLKSLNRFLDSIIETIPAVVFLKTAVDLRYERVNKAALEFLEIKRDQIEGKTDYEIFNHAKAEEFRSRDKSVLQKKQIEEIPMESVETTSGIKWLQTRKIAILNEHGEAQHLLGFSIDITEKKKTQETLLHTEEKLRQSQKLESIGRLAGGVAHDFNNLLGIILGYSELILGQSGPIESFQEGISAIKNAATRGAGLTRQLLAFSRRQILQPKILSINELMTNMESLLSRLLGENIEIILNLASNLRKVKADPSQIDQVIMNLLINARDAMPKGGKLIIQTYNAEFTQKDLYQNPTYKLGKFAVLSVHDTGIGMDQQTLDQIFEPFFTTKGKGTGLGLSTVLGIVEQSQGFMKVESKINKGSVFKAHLPAIDGADEGESEVIQDITTDLRGTKTILLVEDELELRTLIGKMLKNFGYTVLEAGCPEDAISLAKVHQKQIKLLLSDIMMPGMESSIFVETLMTLIPSLQVILISGHPFDTLNSQSLQNQSISFLQKPFLPKELALKVKEAIHQRRGQVSS